MSDTEFAERVEAERERLRNLMRLPWDQWGHGEAKRYLCPLCSAWVWSPDKHRDWHLRMCQ